MFLIFWLTYCVLFIFFQALHQHQRLSQLQQSLVPLHFQFPDVVITMGVTPIIGSFIFRVTFSGNWSGSMHQVDIALQELWSVSLMPCRRAFPLSGKVVALHLNNSITYVFNQGGALSLFLSRLAFCILNLAKNMLLLLFQHAYLPILLWKPTIYHEEGWFQKLHLFPCIGQAACQVWGQEVVDLLVSSHTNQCQHYYTWQNSLPLGALRLNTFNHPWTYQVTHVFLLLLK